MTPTATRPRILIVEDSIFVLMMLEAVCEDLDWQIVGPAMRLDEALRLATHEPIDAALVDVNLYDEFSWPVAAALMTRGIPFAFGTGYDATLTLPAAFASAPVMPKPYLAADIQRQVLALLAVG